MVGEVRIGPRLRKYHALGNDYLVAEPQESGTTITPDLVRNLCARQLGVGADGLLVGPFEVEEGIGLLLYNSDGTSCEKSGNGLRIFARHLVDTGRARSGDVVLVPPAGPCVVSTSEDGQVRVGMGSPSFLSSGVGLPGPDREVVSELLRLGGNELRVTAVDIGNPHCVVVLDEVSEVCARDFGPRIAEDPLFAERCNVQFAQVISDREVRIEIWERGSGYTLSSGSSATAVFAALHRQGLCRDQAAIHSPGGMLEVSISAGELALTGPVAYVFSADLSGSVELEAWT